MHYNMQEINVHSKPDISQLSPTRHWNKMLSERLQTVEQNETIK